jgi:hypothetical protein
MQTNLNQIKKKSAFAIIFLWLILPFFAEGGGSATAQDLTVKGKVLDADGNSIPGASVFIKGTTLGVTTDMEGDYTMRNVPPGSTMVFSFIGYVTQEVPVAGRTTINVILLEDTHSLEEVTIVAFGTQK